jgi:hypothetical protein
MYWLTVYLQSPEGTPLDKHRIAQPYSTIEAAKDRAKALQMLPRPTHYCITDAGDQIIAEGLINA